MTNWQSRVAHGSRVGKASLGGTDSASAIKDKRYIFPYIGTIHRMNTSPLQDMVQLSIR